MIYIIFLVTLARYLGWEIWSYLSDLKRKYEVAEGL
jgi:hypothetical protein